jgi:hypothetical protein
MTSAVSKSNQIVRIFQYGSGDKLSTVPIIFTRQSKSFITQEISGFLSANHKHKINTAQTSKNVEDNFLPMVGERRTQQRDRR